MSNPKLYMDSCCVIDIARVDKGHTLTNGRESEVGITKKILEAAKAGDIDLYTSTLTIAECRHAKGDLDEDVKRIFESVLQSGQIFILADPHPFIVNDARDLLWVHGIDGLSGVDSVHLATALYYECKEFITVDEPILKKAGDFTAVGLRIVKPSECKSLPGDYAQEKIRYEE